MLYLQLIKLKFNRKHTEESKNIFRPGVISENPPRSRDSLYTYLQEPKIENQQISSLMIPIDNPFKYDHFL